MNGRKPNKQEAKWIAAILEYGCVICKEHRHVFSPAEVHHINGKDNHLDTIGLCFHDHRQGGNTPDYVSRHPHKAEFEKRYGTEQGLLYALRMEIGDYE